MSKFYQYRQNNSGGGFSGNYINYIIEADSDNEANSIAEQNGIYFDGVESGSDCDCCGDRWSRTWDSEGDSKPTIYSTVHNPDGKEHLDWGLKSVIIYKDGREEIFKV